MRRDTATDNSNSKAKYIFRIISVGGGCVIKFNQFSGYGKDAIPSYF